MRAASSSMRGDDAGVRRAKSERFWPARARSSAGTARPRARLVVDARHGQMKLKPGVLSRSALQELFSYMKSVKCALPAVNVISSHGLVAALQAAREAKSPVIVQFSNGGGHFFAGKFLDNKGEHAAVAGSV